MNKLYVGLFVVISVMIAPKSVMAANMHDDLTKVLSTYVRDGATNFQGLCKDNQLKQYIKRVQFIDPDAINENNDRFAFWLNVYSAYSLDAICQKYPIRSVNDLNSGGLVLSVILKKSVWDRPFVIVNQRAYNLRQVDHEILRPRFKDPRIQFAIACGAIGCGAFRSEAYEGAIIDQQLDDQTRTFINDVRLNTFDPTTKTATLSPLFNWSSKDFGKDQGEVLLFISKYLPQAVAQSIRENPKAWKIKYNQYDLTLNKQKG